MLYCIFASIKGLIIIIVELEYIFELHIDYKLFFFVLYVTRFEIVLCCIQSEELYYIVP